MNYKRGSLHLIAVFALFISFSSCINQSRNVKITDISLDEFIIHDAAGEQIPAFEEVINVEIVSHVVALSPIDLGFPRIEHVINSYEKTIKKHSNRYGFDWRLILAVMNQESRFRVRAVSHRGAYGLMQIMPTTGRDLSNALGIEGVSNPKDNIAGGVYYLWRLYNLFESDDNSLFSGLHDDDRIRLTLAAYNGGPSRVRDAQRLAMFLQLDPHSWETIRDLLPMLSRRYDSLHQYIWESGRPTGGYFMGWPETINYVESVMVYYDHYRDIFE